MLATIRNTLRPHLDLRAEYAIRRGIYRSMPVAHRSSHARVVHACLWKTASQWVRLILSDPRIYCAGGHLPFVTSDVRDNADRRKALMKAPRSALLACYEPYPSAKQMVAGAPLRATLVVRDPRELLVSWYISTRYSHDPTENVMRRRAEMSGMDDIDGMIYAASEFAKEFPPIVNSWLNSPQDDLKVVRFEDLTGSEGLAAWSDIMNFYDIKLPESTLAQVLQTYAIETLKKTKSQSGDMAKYDNAGRRRVRDFDDPRIWSAFSRETHDLVTRMGYD